MALKRHTRHFPAEARSVSAVRRFVRGAVGPGWEDLAEDAVLLASEIATNVVEHARTDYEVRVLGDGRRLRVEVADGSSVIPAVRDLALDSERGRGLVLLEKLAAAWGAEEGRDGKIVWFELAGGPRRPTADGGGLGEPGPGSPERA